MANASTESLAEAERQVEAETVTALETARDQVKQMGGSPAEQALLIASHENAIANRRTIALAEARAKADPVAALFGLADPAR